MKKIVKVMLLATTLVAGAAYADAGAFTESHYPFIPNAVSPEIGHKVDQRNATESDYPRIDLSSTKTREQVLREFIEYKRTHPNDVYPY